ncbi:MAG: DUF2283 domain-containing protein [Planctomycetes bacterium]|nr:DUF2283 domain-containing protein [Planctomycetota bacterium]
MNIRYDQEVDALYIRLIEGRQECRVLRLSDDVALNLGPNEQLVGIEILDARRVLGSGSQPELTVENILAKNSDNTLSGVREVAPPYENKP